VYSLCLGLNITQVFCHKLTNCLHWNLIMEFRSRLQSSMLPLDSCCSYGWRQRRRQMLRNHWFIIKTLCVHMHTGQWQAKQHDNRDPLPFWVTACMTPFRSWLLLTMFSRWNAKKYPRNTVPSTDIAINSCKYYTETFSFLNVFSLVTAGEMDERSHITKAKTIWCVMLLLGSVLILAATVHYWWSDEEH